MNSDIKNLLIINPSSAAGRTGKIQKNIVSLFQQHFNGECSIVTTKAPLDAVEITRHSIQQRNNFIIAVGGDGTVNEVVNGFFEDGMPINSGCTLGIITSGTGLGLAHSLNLPKRIEDQISVLFNGCVRTIDVCRLTYIDFKNKVRTRYFVNECQIGIGATVVSRVKSRHKIFGGTVAFTWGALKSIVGAETHRVVVYSDNNEEQHLSLHGITIGNGSWMGGSMNLTPNAQLDDGLFDVLFIHSQSLLRRLYGFSKIYSGKHLELPAFEYKQCKKITVESSEQVLVSADGELLGTLPCTIEIIPHILRVCVPLSKENY